MNIPIILPPATQEVTPALKLVADIVNKGGRLDARMLMELGREFPAVPVTIEWEDHTRTAYRADVAPAVIAQTDKLVRVVGFSKTSMEVLCGYLGEMN